MKSDLQEDEIDASRIPSCEESSIIFLPLINEDSNMNAKLFLNFVVLFFSPILFAEFQFVQERDQKEEYFFSIYFQDGLWRVDQFQVDNRGYLHLDNRKSYGNDKEALASLKEKSRLMPFSRTSQNEVLAERNRAAFLWKAENQWNWHWELEFAKWVRENASAEFFTENKIPVDCADAIYAFRWIFAKINKLPVGSRQANGKLVTHETHWPQWASLPTHEDWQKDRRFRRVLDNILNTTYTHTLFRDSYPIAIDDQSFREGSFFLELFSSSGHTSIVNEVNSNTTTKIPLNLIWAIRCLETSLYSVRVGFGGKTYLSGASLGFCA